MPIESSLTQHNCSTAAHEYFEPEPEFDNLDTGSVVFSFWRRLHEFGCKPCVSPDGQGWRGSPNTAPERFLSEDLYIYIIALLV